MVGVWSIMDTHVLQHTSREVLYSLCVRLEYGGRVKYSCGDVCVDKVTEYKYSTAFKTSRLSLVRLYVASLLDVCSDII